LRGIQRASQNDNLTELGSRLVPATAFGGAGDELHQGQAICIRGSLLFSHGPHQINFLAEARGDIKDIARTDINILQGIIAVNQSIQINRNPLAFAKQIAVLERSELNRRASINTLRQTSCACERLTDCECAVQRIDARVHHLAERDKTVFGKLARQNGNAGLIKKPLDRLLNVLFDSLRRASDGRDARHKMIIQFAVRRNGSDRHRIWETKDRDLHHIADRQVEGRGIVGRVIGWRQLFEGLRARHGRGCRERRRFNSAGLGGGGCLAGRAHHEQDET